MQNSIIAFTSTEWRTTGSGGTALLNLLRQLKVGTTEVTYHQAIYVRSKSIFVGLFFKYLFIPESSYC